MFYGIFFYFAKCTVDLDDVYIYIYMYRVYCIKIFFVLFWRKLLIQTTREGDFYDGGMRKHILYL